MPIIHANNPIEEYRIRASKAKGLHLMAGRVKAESTQAVARAILPTLNVQADDVLVDVGCGDGTLLAMATCRVRIGISPTDEEVACLRMAHPDIRFLRGLAQQLPLESRSANKVVCNGVIMLLANDEEVRTTLREFARISCSMVYVGEVLSIAEVNPFPHDSVLRWLWALLRKNGLYSFAAGVKEVAVSALTDKLMLIHSENFYICPPEKFIAMATDCGLRLQRHAPHSASGFNYWFTV